LRVEAAFPSIKVWKSSFVKFVKVVENNFLIFQDDAIMTNDVPLPISEVFDTADANKALSLVSLPLRYTILDATISTANTQYVCQ
jgi:hypothetical protein